MKTLSLLKACLSQDMNMFKYSTKVNSSKIKKILFPVLLFIIVCISIGTYSFMLSKQLAPFHLTYIMLSMFIAVVTIITFIEGIYKSQGILFETKDNDLLFSLPISKSKILFVRIFKLLLFQYIYNLMFILPAFVAYIYYERPGISFYLISLLMTFLIPIIPTVISSALGYIIKLFSSKSNFKKIIQTVLSAIIFIFIFFVSMNMESFMKDVVSKATSINDILIKLYYPIGLYINLINKFSLLELFKLLLINIIPFALFLVLGSKLYFKIISNSKSGITRRKSKIKNIKFIKRRIVHSLTLKELKRYFSSPTYMFNTSFGLLLTLVMSILLCIKGRSIFELVLSNYGKGTGIKLEVLYYGLILFATSMTSITSSSISLEGKTINITKSLPIDEKDILKSKIIYPFIIELPFIIIGELIFFIFFKPSIFYIISIILIGIIMIFLSSIIGLIVNLKYPKMNATNDTEVVKQSISSMISVFIGMGIFLGSILLIIFLLKYINIKTLIVFHISLLMILGFILYLILMKTGIKDYRKINI